MTSQLDKLVYRFDKAEAIKLQQQRSIGVSLVRSVVVASLIGPWAFFFWYLFYLGSVQGYIEFLKIVQAWLEN